MAHAARTTEEWARVPAPVRIGNSEYTVTIFSDRTVALGFGLPVHGGFSVLTRDPPTEPPVEELPPLLPQAEDDEPSEPLAMDEWVHMERLEHDPVVMRVELPPPPPLKKEGRRLTPDEVRRLRPLLKIRDQVLAGCAPVSDVFASDPGFWLANRTPPPSPPASPPRKRQKRMGISVSRRCIAITYPPADSIQDKENIPVCEPSAARVPEFKTSTSSGLRPAPSVPALKEEVKFVFEQPSTGGSIAKNDKGKARATRPTDSDDDYDPTDDSDDDYQEPSGSSRKRKPLCDANTLTPTLEILRSTVPCPMTGCQHVFDSKACGDAVVTKHLASCHRSTLVVPYKIPCPVDGCKSVFLCPKREQYENRIKNVGRHMRTAHMHPYRLLCPFKKCTYRINRKSSMVRHLSSTNNKNHI